MPPFWGPWNRSARTSSSKSSSSSLPRRYMRVNGVSLEKRASAASWFSLAHSLSTKSPGGVQTDEAGSEHALGTCAAEDEGASWLDAGGDPGGAEAGDTGVAGASGVAAGGCEG